MKNTLLILMLLILPMYLAADPKETEAQKRISQLENQIGSLQQKIKELNQDNDCQKQLIQTSNSGVSTQLTAATWTVGIIAVFITVILFVLGGYVSYKVKKSSDTLKENEELLGKQHIIKKEIDELNTLIKENLDGLYLRIKNEETKHLILRLKNVPEDIANLSEALLSRELVKEYYSPIKESYLLLKNTHQTITDSIGYMTLFFQHFAGLALFDPDINKTLEEEYTRLIPSSFKNDILKTTGDIITACVDNGLSSQKDKLNSYLKAIVTSKYSELEELYKTIFEKLIGKENQFLLYELMDKGPLLEKVRYSYGKMLKKAYGQSQNTETQKLILKEIDELITKLEKEQAKT
jgi:hypothetical protein